MSKKVKSKKDMLKHGKKSKADKAKLKAHSRMRAKKKIKKSKRPSGDPSWITPTALRGAANSINMSPVQKGLATKAVGAILRAALMAQEDGTNLGKVLRCVEIGSDGPGGRPLICLSGFATVLGSKRAISEVQASSRGIFGPKTELAARAILEELLRQEQSS